MSYGTSGNRKRARPSRPQIEHLMYGKALITPEPKPTGETVAEFIARGGKIKRVAERKLVGANLPKYSGHALENHPINVKAQATKAPIGKKSRIFLKKQHAEYVDKVRKANGG